MIRTVYDFLILLGSIFLGIQLQHDPGYVLVTLNHWSMETSLWVALFGLLLLFVFLHLLLQCCHKLYQAPSSISSWRAKRLAQKAQATTRRGLIEYSEGYWHKAQTHLIQALPNADTPLLNYLTAARAAQKMGDSKLRDHYLREAQQSMPEAKIAVELTQAQLQLANNQWEQALATLRHLQDLAPRHPYVLKLLMNLYEQVRDWPQMIGLLSDLKKHKVLSPQLFAQLEQKTYQQAMIDLAKQNHYEAIKKLFASRPKSLINNAAIIAEYVRILFKNLDYNEAEIILRTNLKKEFDAELIELYGQLVSDDRQLAFAEFLLKKYPHSAPLFLCLGRQCRSQHLWGKAKHYLEQSIQLYPTPEAYSELGTLHEKLNDALLACESYKKGLQLATMKGNPL